MADNSSEHSSSATAPHPGSERMPRWNTAELPDAPRFRLRNWTAMIGPGLVMGSAAIGGGEWLTGPMVTARFGGALLWLATLSILGQVIYNLEISRYTLYTGEPIFTGKFRTLPGPLFWVFVYLFLDFGSFFPYLAAFAATPLATVLIGEIPDAVNGHGFTLFGQSVDMSHEWLLRLLSYAVFLGAMIPLLFGGKILTALKWVMSFKLITVIGFLLVLAIGYSTFDTWTEIISGFVKFGNVPVRRVEDSNGDGRLDPEEDWDGDGHADLIEPKLDLRFGTIFREPWATDLDRDGQPDNMVQIEINGRMRPWPDLDNDGRPDQTAEFDTDGDGQIDQSLPLDRNGDGKLDRFVDLDNDGTLDGDNIENVFVSLFAGRGLPDINWSMIALLSAMVAISGSGGLSNTPISNYTRDQGWGMGHHVGAIPSIVGGQHLQLSHVGSVFTIGVESMRRWGRWYRHVLRDQLIVWMPACFIGLALPSMLSAQFLKRGTAVADKWVAATMTADGVSEAVGPSLGPFFWFMTLFCGFLVLAPSMAVTADGVIRRWVDVFWTSSRNLREVHPKNIRYVYFGVLAVYAVFGMTMLSLKQPQTLLEIATTIYNFALGFSCWHALAINLILLPRELRPNWFMRIGLFTAGLFFWVIATMSTLSKFGYL